jgi:hypothetical protein
MIPAAREEPGNSSFPANKHLLPIFGQSEFDKWRHGKKSVATAGGFSSIARNFHGVGKWRMDLSVGRL